MLGKKLSGAQRRKRNLELEKEASKSSKFLQRFLKKANVESGGEKLIAHHDTEIALIGDGNEIEDNERSIQISCTLQYKVAENEDVFVSTAEQESMHDDATTESDNTPTSASVLM